MPCILNTRPNDDNVRPDGGETCPFDSEAQCTKPVHVPCARVGFRGCLVWREAITGYDCEMEAGK